MRMKMGDVREDLFLQIWLLSGPDEHLAGGTSSTKAPESQLLCRGCRVGDSVCVSPPVIQTL